MAAVMLPQAAHLSGRRQGHVQQAAVDAASSCAWQMVAPGCRSPSALNARSVCERRLQWVGAAQQPRSYVKSYRSWVGVAGALVRISLRTTEGSPARECFLRWRLLLRCPRSAPPHSSPTGQEKRSMRSSAIDAVAAMYIRRQLRRVMESVFAGWQQLCTADFTSTEAAQRRVRTDAVEMVVRLESSLQEATLVRRTLLLWALLTAKQKASAAAFRQMQYDSVALLSSLCSSLDGRQCAKHAFIVWQLQTLQARGVRESWRQGHAAGLGKIVHWQTHTQRCALLRRCYGQWRLLLRCHHEAAVTMRTGRCVAVDSAVALGRLAHERDRVDCAFHRWYAACSSKIWLGQVAEMLEAEVTESSAHSSASSSTASCCGHDEFRLLLTLVRFELARDESAEHAHRVVALLLRRRMHARLLGCAFGAWCGATREATLERMAGAVVRDLQSVRQEFDKLGADALRSSASRSVLEAEMRRRDIEESAQLRLLEARLQQLGQELQSHRRASASQALEASPVRRCADFPETPQWGSCGAVSLLSPDATFRQDARLAAWSGEGQAWLKLCLQAWRRRAEAGILCEMLVLEGSVADRRRPLQAAFLAWRGHLALERRLRRLDDFLGKEVLRRGDSLLFRCFCTWATPQRVAVGQAMVRAAPEEVVSEDSGDLRRWKEEIWQQGRRRRQSAGSASSHSSSTTLLQESPQLSWEVTESRSCASRDSAPFRLLPAWDDALGSGRRHRNSDLDISWTSLPASVDVIRP
eukprot:TRINITY_DN49092_c0_g1_i2.p1 TRINITY_DN49092_c0_g1~~TRINITY_DN49092_c0_g1_i2.p1  ORF type:complete len:753 (+),score=141.15 TRINITY_DN49092_c0_g1_i2:93-2351(+)